MKQPKLVILRGKQTSGKSTAWHTLKKNEKMKNWLFVDHTHLKTTLGKELGKHSLFAVLKTVMPSKQDIIIEEMSEKTLKKYINYYIKKYNYKMITFQFEINIKTAHKRNIQRAKDKWHPYIKKEQLKDYHKMHEQRFDKNAFLVDCDKLSKRQVVEFILKKLRLKNN
jgi:predicted kinase